MSAETKQHSKILQAIRSAAKKSGLDAFIIPHADEYQNEYHPDANKRFEYATGFTGSAGMAILTQKSGAIFVDGRYTLQVKDEIPTDILQDLPLDYTVIEQWLKDNVKQDDVIGYDPRLHTVRDFERLRKIVEQANASLKAVDINPVETVWGEDRPAYPTAPITPHAIEFAGVASADKRHAILQQMKENKVDAIIICDLPSIAWLLNIRGNDIPFNPLTLSRLVLHQNGTADFYVDERKITEEVRTHLGEDIHIHSEADFEQDLQQFSGKTVQLDFAQASVAIYEILRKNHTNIVDQTDPCSLPKSMKNETEQQGTVTAHRRDGVAVTKFLYRMAHEGQSGTVDELTAERWLEDQRKGLTEYLGPSFSTISGAGANGAIVHYRATERTNRLLEKNTLYLVDSGGQYRDGTTDITRTIAIGEPTREMIENYTRVLKGHIAVARAALKKGVTTGADIDPLARAPLQEAGLDYAHGTGHGVGSYLCVHEGPIGISRHYNKIPFEIGMVVSNEPGYYKTGAYGIRIENLVMVQKGKNGDLQFLDLTLAPYDRRLIDVSMLNAQETRWLDRYHRRVYKTLAPYLSRAEKEWLKQQTAPFERKILGFIPRF